MTGPNAPLRWVALVAALTVVAAALSAPLDVHESFSAHMVQHLLLMIVAAPLLAYALPWTVPRLLRNPVAVWMLAVTALWGWHMPVLYELALAHEPLHGAEHLSFLATALLFWAAVWDSRGRRPVALLLVLTTGFASTVLGAVLAFASEPLYGHTLEDQQLAGSLMWGPPGLLYAAVMAWLLWRWFAEMEAAA